MTRIPLVISFWFMIATYVIHILDESLLGGSFVEKIRQHWWPEYSWQKFFWFNAGVLVHYVHERRALRPPRSSIAIPAHGLGCGTLRQRTVACLVGGSLPRVFSRAFNQRAVLDAVLLRPVLPSARNAA